MVPPGFIGIFDSGVGGLAVHRAARALLPGHDFVYVADTGHGPYGGRPTGYIVERSAVIAEALARQGAAALVVACNTATVTAVAELRARHALPIVGIEPAIKPAVAASAGRPVFVLATQRTAESDSVAELCRRHGAEAPIHLQPCPGLADQVEAGHVDGGVVTALLEEYLAPALAAGPAVVVLGCTHFTFLADQIQRRLGAGYTVIEPSEAVARQLARRLVGGAAEPGRGTGQEAFYTTGAMPGDVGRVMSALLGRPVEAMPGSSLGL